MENVQLSFSKNGDIAARYNAWLEMAGADNGVEKRKKELEKPTRRDSLSPGRIILSAPLFDINYWNRVIEIVSLTYLIIRRERVHLCLGARSVTQVRIYARCLFSFYRNCPEAYTIGVNPAGDAGDVSPPIFWLVGTPMGMSPPIFWVAM